MLGKLFEKMAYRLGSEKRSQRMKEAIQNKEIPIEVNCIGTDKYEILSKQVVIRYFNEKLGIWQEHPGVEYRDICPICGRLMLVRAIKGTTWLALCSKKCYEKFDQLKENQYIEEAKDSLFPYSRGKRKI